MCTLNTEIQHSFWQVVKKRSPYFQVYDNCGSCSCRVVEVLWVFGASFDFSCGHRLRVSVMCVTVIAFWSKSLSTVQLYIMYALLLGIHFHAAAF